MKKFLRKLWYNKIYWKIYNYFHYKSPIFIGTLNIFKLYKDWLKAYKHFHKPIMKIYKMNIDENNLGSDYFYIETETYNKLLYFNIESCGFKLKWGEYRFENVPYICIIWRNKTKWIIGLEAPLYDYNRHTNTYQRNNDLYWESILKYNYSEYKGDIIKTYIHNIWVCTHILKDLDENGLNKKIYEYDTILPCLKNKSAEKIIQFLNKKYLKKVNSN